MKRKVTDIDLIRAKLRKAVETSEMSQEEIGISMGFSRSGARQAVSRILNPEIAYDPRLSTLLALARAIKKPLSDLI